MNFQPSGIDLNAVAQAFVDARRAGRSIAAFPGQVPRSIDEAYRAQSLAIEAWPGALAGWKVAKINDPWRGPLGADRFIGPIFAETSGIPIPASSPPTGADRPPSKSNWV